MTFIASLPWYDFSEIHHLTDQLWFFIQQNITKSGLAAPQSLCRDIDYREQWKSTQLLFSQACGYDVIKTSINDLQIIATPCYDVQGCSEYKYSSFIVVHKDSGIYNLNQLQNKTCAINEKHSHSGKNILFFTISNITTQPKFFSSFVITGSHENSLKMVCEKKVTTASIDCLSYNLLKKYRPQLFDNIRIISQTIQAPAPPYVTSIHRTKEEVEILKKAIRKTWQCEKVQPILKALSIKDIYFSSKEEYNIILEMEKEAEKVAITNLQPH